MSNPSRCPVCEVPASLKCGACKQVFYCGKEHQKIDWIRGHKSKCKCFEITYNDVLGRHMRATRDIKLGEVILSEAPLVYGPKTASYPICLGCHRTLPTPVHNYYKCKGCDWPMCGPDCEKSIHHKDECELMTARKFSAKVDYTPVSQQGGKKESSYCVILPLRCMLLKKKNPDQYAQFDALEDHLTERLNTPLYRILRANLSTFMNIVLGITDWTETEILRIAARLDTNAFEVRQPTQNRKVRAIYPLASMLSHDCVSNTRHMFDEDMNIIFIAQKPIPKKAIICTSYTQPLKSTLMRREHLLQAKCFECTCKRCQDPTELNTFIGAVLCTKCKVGKIISTNPMDNSAVWSCQLCPHQLSAKQINLGNTSMQKEIETLDKSSVQAFEDFLYRYRDILHEKNTHVLQVKYALTQLYGRAPGFTITEMNEAAIKRKIELCQELLDIAEVVDGHWSIFRGNLLLDLQEAMFVQAKREYVNGLLTQSATQDKMMQSMQLLREAINIVQLEPGMQQTLSERAQLLTNELEME